MECVLIDSSIGHIFDPLLWMLDHHVRFEKCRLEQQQQPIKIVSLHLHNYRIEYLDL